MAVYSAAGIREKIPIHCINYPGKRHLVAVASALILHKIRITVWTALSCIWNQCIGIKLCFGGHKKKYG